MERPDEPTRRVLACANRVAGTMLSLPGDGDLPLDAFGFDSLSAFAFMLELERTCGITFDEALFEADRVRTIRSVAALVVARESAGPDANDQIRPERS